MKQLLRKPARLLYWAVREARTQFRSSALPCPTAGAGRFIWRDPRVKVSVRIARDAVVELHGDIIFQSDLGRTGETLIRVAPRAKLIVNGDFIIGPNIDIKIFSGAELVLGVRRAASGSGITEDSRIMVQNRVVIGADSIIAWNTFITDSDWHQIDGQPTTIPTEIGEHVWIAHGVSILKGSRIGDGCIVAAHALCNAKEYPPCSLIGGVPASVLRNNVRWTRDLAGGGPSHG